MEHTHGVHDSDTRFVINPATRQIRNESSRKTTVIQFDHNSERFTFECPRYIEGHDMSACNKVEIHYINIDPKTKQQNTGLYVSDDLEISSEDENKVVCSWLISQNATQIIGALNFVVCYKCIENGECVYAWNTAISSVSVSDGINASESVATEYADVLEQWRAELYNAGYINASTMQNEVNVLKARMDTFTNLPGGSTAGDAELQDIRVDANGNVHETAGCAVRTQVISAKDDLLKALNDTQTLRLYCNFVNGTLSGGALNTHYKYRVSTDTVISFDHDVILNIANGYRLAIHEFADGVFSADWGWRTTLVKVNAGVSFKCMIAKVADDTTTVADLIEFTNAVTFETNSIKERNAITQSIYSIDNVKARYTFEPGDIKTDTGKDFDGNKHRLRTKGICYTAQDIVIVGNAQHRVYLYTFDDSNYTNAKAVGWVLYDDSVYTIAAGTYFRLLVAHLDDSVVTYGEIVDVKTSELYSVVKMYTAEYYEHMTNVVTRVENIGVVHKSNILSIAHQGFSTTEQYFGNSRASAVIGAYLNGFDCSEIDLQFSSDGIPVCCHDATFIDTGDNVTAVTIAEHTLNELKTYGYYGETIATFEEIVAECKRLGIGLYVDKIGNIDTSEKWAAVFAIIKKYSMTHNVTWLAYNSKISAWDQAAKFAIVAFNLSDSVIESAISIANAGHEVFINVNYENCTVEQIIEWNNKLPANVYIGVWTIDDLTIYEQYKPYVCAITSNKISDVMTNKT